MDRPRQEGRDQLAPLLLGLLLLILTSPIARSDEPADPASADPPTLRKVGRVRMDDVELPPEAMKKLSAGRANPGRTKPLIQQAVGLLRRDRPVQALARVHEAMDLTPHDPFLLELLAIGRGMLGQYADAVTAFALCGGGDAYEAMGLSLHADGLRALGRGEEAAALRRSTQLDVMDTDAELDLLLEIADDFMAGGDPFAAEEALREAEGLYPHSGLVHRMLYEAMTAQGDTEGAGFHLWMADTFLSGPSVRELRAEAQELLAAGQPLLAEPVVEDATRRRRRSPVSVALVAELSIEQGDPLSARKTLEGSYWAAREYPELIAARALSLQAMSRPKEAREMLVGGLTLYPTHPDLLRAQRRLGAL
ncbi:MAG: hypothetical protein H6740_17200 [Alphaproteobacteria bacterium]|nr:hypothetical protein [Alphaproteobacteria bacterium]